MAQRSFTALSKQEFEVFSQFSLNNFWATFHVAAYEFQKEWRLAVLNSGAPGGHKDGYIKEIKISSPDEGNWVVESEGWYTDLVEEGHGPWDLKKGLLSSDRARRAKDGSIYTIVPMRHNVKELKAAGVYQDVADIGKEFNEAMGVAQQIASQKYRVIGFKFEDNAYGKTIRRAVYQPGATRVDAPGKFQGIVKTGDTGQGGYLTFRVVSTKSDQSSWIHPGYKAEPVFDSVASSFENKLRKKLQNALLKDMQEANK